MNNPFHKKTCWNLKRRKAKQKKGCCTVQLCCSVRPRGNPGWHGSDPGETWRQPRGDPGATWGKPGWSVPGLPPHHPWVAPILNPRNDCCQVAPGSPLGALGHPWVTLSHPWVTLGHPRVTLGHPWVTPGRPWVSPDSFTCIKLYWKN